MTDTPELDRAIEVAAASIYREDVVIQDCDRTYARALVAELLRGLRRNPKPETAWDLGYDAALDDVAAVAGLEGEG